jgi:predicted flap endonuclease-1-like 5' DNA nuclease
MGRIMAKSEFKRGPFWDMWAVAAAAGLVLFGVGHVAMGLSLTGAAAVGIVVALVLILAFGLPGRDRTPRPAVAAQVAPVATPAPVAAAVAAPVMAAPAAAAKPASLTAARGGKADDLKIIKGIGPKLEDLCHKLGFYHFDQVAGWTDAEVAWVDDNLEGFKGRVTRDRWVPQAKAIVSLGPDEFLRQLDAGKEF